MPPVPVAQRIKNYESAPEPTTPLRPKTPPPKMSLLADEYDALDHMARDSMTGPSTREDDRPRRSLITTPERERATRTSAATHKTEYHKLTPSASPNGSQVAQLRRSIGRAAAPLEQIFGPPPEEQPRPASAVQTSKRRSEYSPTADRVLATPGGGKHTSAQKIPEAQRHLPEPGPMSRIPKTEYVPLMPVDILNQRPTRTKSSTTLPPGRTTASPKPGNDFQARAQMLPTSHKAPHISQASIFSARRPSPSSPKHEKEARNNIVEMNKTTREQLEDVADARGSTYPDPLVDLVENLDPTYESPRKRRYSARPDGEPLHQPDQVEQ